MCTNCAINIDNTKKDAFAEKMVALLNQGALGMMISIGHRTNLFDTMDGMPPATSGDIAEAAGLNERYVREWLGAMVTGRIVDYNEDSNTYTLPAEHAVWLTRKNAPDNLAVTTQWVSVLASAEDRIVECFQKGGGLDYAEYNRFNEVMAAESQQTVVLPLVDTLLPLVDGLTEKLEKGISVLDLGCGSGRALIAMAKAFPASRFTGYDFLDSAVGAAEEEAARQKVSNVAFLQRDAARIDEREKFDLVCTFDSVHDQAEPEAVLKNIYNALKPGGTYFCQDIAGSSLVHKNMDHPVGPLLYTISCMHCMSVSLGKGGAGLGAMWGKELAVEMFKKAGFGHVEIKSLEHDFMNYYYIMEK